MMDRNAPPLAEDPTILYRGGYKYQLAEDYRGHADLALPGDVRHEWFEIDRDGTIRIRAGYAWDGPSGPTIDTRTFMRGSLKHDMFYAAIRAGLVSPAFKDAIDAELRYDCRTDGMSWLRAWYVWKAVQWFGHRAIAGGPRPILRAPTVAQPLRELPAPRRAVSEEPADPPLAGAVRQAGEAITNAFRGERGDDDD